MTSGIEAESSSGRADLFLSSNSGGLYPKLAGGVTLHVTPRYGTVFRDGVTRTTQVSRDLVAMLALCNGARSFATIIEEHVTSEGRGDDADIAAAIVELVHSVSEGLLEVSTAASSGAITVTGSSLAFIPTHLQIELTNVCNLRCSHCYRSSGPAVKDERLTTDELFAILDDLAARGLRSVELTGGEPMMHPDFARIVRYCVDRFHLVGVLTNGTLISPRFIEEWLPFRGKFVFSISLDGSTAEVHERRRGVPGSFARTLAGIGLLAKYGFTNRVSMTVDETNWDDVERTLLVARDAGASSFAYTPVLPFGRASETFKLWSKDPAAVLTFENDLLTRYRGFIQAVSESTLTELESQGSCGAGSRAAAMDPGGRVRPCVTFDSGEAVFGSLAGQSPEEVFGSEIALALDSVPPPTPAICGSCQWVLFCRYCVQRATLASQWVGEECRWMQQPEARRFQELAIQPTHA